MQAERLGYRPWDGTLRSPALRWIPIARCGLRSIFRRRIFWLFLFLGLLNFLLHFALIYALNTFPAQVQPDFAQRRGGMPRLLRDAIFTGTGESYRNFISFQGGVVMLLLGFAGAHLIGNDFRFRAVAFYLSKPVGKVHYFLGKLAAAAGLTALITLVPALMLFLEYGAFTESLDYFRDSQRILWSIVGYGLLVSVGSGVLILGVAALLQRTIPIVVVWGGIFVFLPLVGEMFRALSRERGEDVWQWGLLSFWSVLSWTSNSFFGIRDDSYRLPYTLLTLAAWLAAALWLFWRRVRAVDVVR
ncbi:MAG: hypothetical protein HY721_10250 [Planctomycetes bacterium]|nr:hypothetical protein [Planctomycetota bacterium]